VKLDKYEQSILEDIENDNFQQVSNLNEELNFLKEASSNYTKKVKK
jgi:predicted DNA binding CopG/RHH family protein